MSRDTMEKAFQKMNKFFWNIDWKTSLHSQSVEQRYRSVYDVYVEGVDWLGFNRRCWEAEERRNILYGRYRRPNSQAPLEMHKKVRIEYNKIWSRWQKTLEIKEGMLCRQTSQVSHRKDLDGWTLFWEYWQHLTLDTYRKLVISRQAREGTPNVVPLHFPIYVNDFPGLQSYLDTSAIDAKLRGRNKEYSRLRQPTGSPREAPAPVRYCLL